MQSRRNGNTTDRPLCRPVPPADSTGPISDTHASHASFDVFLSILMSSPTPSPSLGPNSSEEVPPTAEEGVSGDHNRDGELLRRVEFPNGDVWEGETLPDGTPHGQGTFLFKNRNKYTG